MNWRAKRALLPSIVEGEFARYVSDALSNGNPFEARNRSRSHRFALSSQISPAQTAGNSSVRYTDTFCLSASNSGPTRWPALNRKSSRFDRLMICSPTIAATTASAGSVKKVIGNRSEP